MAVREKGAALDRERQAKEALEAAEALNAKVPFPPVPRNPDRYVVENEF